MGATGRSRARHARDFQVTPLTPVMDSNRRHFLGVAAATLAATRLGLAGHALSSAGRLLEGPGQLKQIVAGVLDVGYFDAGPSDGPAVVLLHGWPYDVHSFDNVTPILAAAGYRVIVPFLRGYGSTR